LWALPAQPEVDPTSPTIEEQGKDIMSNVWMNLLLAVQIIAALAIIGLVLVQQGKGADMGASFGTGASGSLFGATGSANFLSRSTAVAAVVFFVATLGLAYGTGKLIMPAAPDATGGSVLEKGLTPPPTLPTVPPATQGSSVPASSAAPGMPSPAGAPMPAQAPGVVPSTPSAVPAPSSSAAPAPATAAAAVKDAVKDVAPVPAK
jgi:preprotein translocase subunit SecG